MHQSVLNYIHLFVCKLLTVSLACYNSYLSFRFIRGIECLSVIKHSLPAQADLIQTGSAAVLFAVCVQQFHMPTISSCPDMTVLEFKGWKITNQKWCLVEIKSCCTFNILLLMSCSYPLKATRCCVILILYCWCFKIFSSLSIYLSIYVRSLFWVADTQKGLAKGGFK